MHIYINKNDKVDCGLFHNGAHVLLWKVYKIWETLWTLAVTCDIIENRRKRACLSGFGAENVPLRYAFFVGLEV